MHPHCTLTSTSAAQQRRSNLRERKTRRATGIRHDALQGTSSVGLCSVCGSHPETLNWRPCCKSSWRLLLLVPPLLPFPFKFCSVLTSHSLALTLPLPLPPAISTHLPFPISLDQNSTRQGGRRDLHGPVLRTVSNLQGRNKSRHGVLPLGGLHPLPVMRCDCPPRPRPLACPAYVPELHGCK
jgi:hypothetical protein